MERLTAVADGIITFIGDSVQRARRVAVVLGLSGGVDSALVAALAARALGPARVRPFMLPCRPAPAALDDARLVADWLKIDAQTIDLQGMVEAGHKALGNDEALRLGNMMARLRMITLYDRAALLGGLVAGTGNKSEWLLGYSTRHGDAACDIAPILDLYKTQVWELAAFVGVPIRVVDKAPTADLWEGQTDEGELGLTYRAADKIFMALYERKEPLAAVKLHFGEAVVDKLLARVAATEFKRVPVPCPTVQNLFA